MEESPHSDPHWDNFATWASKILNHEQFDDMERTPKKKFASLVGDARRTWEAGDPSWPNDLASALATTNFVNWRVRSTFTDWCRSAPEAARAMLAFLWDPEASIVARIDAANEALPAAVPSGAGTRLNLLSTLLSSESAASYPPYKAETAGGLSRLLDLPPPHGETIGLRYQAFLGLLDEIRDQLAHRGVPVGDRLDIQSLAHILVSYPINDPVFAPWSSRDKLELDAARSGARGGEERSVWWVNQGESFDAESVGGYISCSISDLWHKRSLLQVRPGDIVFHYVRGRILAIGVATSGAFEGLVPHAASDAEHRRFAMVDYYALSTPITLDEIPIEWRKPGGPFNRNGGVIMGYFFGLKWDFAENLFDRFSDRLPSIDRLVATSGPFLVAAGGGPTGWQNDRDAFSKILEDQGRTAIWWSCPLREDHRRTLDANPWLHVYIGAPVGAVAARIRVVEHASKAGSEGLISPWPEVTREEHRGVTHIGESPSGIMKTWFLVDAAEAIEPPIPPSNLSNESGQPVKGSDLLNSFGIWRPRMNVSESSGEISADLRELSARSYLSVPELREIIQLLQDKKQIILEGPPGSGKTYIADLMARHLTGNPLVGDTDDSLEVVQFHQSYGYEDFIQGIRPRTVDGHLEYRLEDGIFKRLCARARANPDRTFVLVIDEINRGNISRIFGELLLLLEYRDRTVVLPYSDEDDEPFSIPPNLLLIGTMNTTDRSLAQIDYALRRRFYFYRLMPTTGANAPVLAAWLAEHVSNETDRREVLDWFLALNEQLTREIGEHFQVGHSYLMQPGIGSPDTLERMWRRAIRPLLEEYFYNRRGDQSTFIDGFAPGKLRPIASGAETVALDES